MELVQRITPRLQIGIMRQRMDDLIAGMMYVMGTASAAKAQALVHHVLMDTSYHAAANTQGQHEGGH